MFDIELTRATIEAGVAVLNRHTSDEFRILPEDEIIRRILLAAMEAQDVDRRAQLLPAKSSRQRDRCAE